MIRVYVAGPFNGRNVQETQRNIRRGLHYSDMVMNEGMSPDGHWEFWDRGIRQAIKNMYEMNHAWLAVADVMLVVKGWEDCQETVREINLAKGVDIPIFYSFDELIRWRNERSSREKERDGTDSPCGNESSKALDEQQVQEK